MDTYSFTVEGRPIPQGSMTPIVSRTTGKAFVRASNDKQLRAWRKAITAAAKGSSNPPPKPLTGAVAVDMRFTYVRPASHTKSDGTLRTGAPVAATVQNTTGDLDKLARAVNDGLTDAEWWNDDVQVTAMICSKVFGENAGVEVHVTPLEDQNG